MLEKRHGADVLKSIGFKAPRGEGGAYKITVDDATMDRLLGVTAVLEGMAYEEALTIVFIMREGGELDATGGLKAAGGGGRGGGGGEGRGGGAGAGGGGGEGAEATGGEFDEEGLRGPAPMFRVDTMDVLRVLDEDVKERVSQHPAAISMAAEMVSDPKRAKQLFEAWDRIELMGAATIQSELIDAPDQAKFSVLVHAGSVHRYSKWLKLHTEGGKSPQELWALAVRLVPGLTRAGVDASKIGKLFIPKKRAARPAADGTDETGGMAALLMKMSEAAASLAVPEAPEESDHFVRLTSASAAGHSAEAREAMTTHSLLATHQLREAQWEGFLDGKP